jgi:hypothetical protein
MPLLFGLMQYVVTRERFVYFKGGHQIIPRIHQRFRQRKGRDEGNEETRDNNSPVQEWLAQPPRAKAVCTEKSRDNNSPEQTAIACSVDTTPYCMEGVGGPPVKNVS